MSESSAGSVPARASVAVVGAGISGLATHHYLRERGVDSVVFEAGEEVGGVIRTREVDGRVVECGPQRTRKTPGVAELVDAAGLSASALEAPDLPLFVYHDGELRRAPLSPRTAVTTDLLSWRGKLRVLLEPLAGPPRDDESVEEYLVRAVGREAADRFAAPLYAGIYGSDPGEMPARYSIAKALDAMGVERSVLATALRSVRSDRDRPPVLSFEDGLQALPRELAAAHDGIHFETPVRTIAHEGNGEGEGDEEGERERERGGEKEGYRVRTERGDCLVDRVVLTTPANVTADVVEGVDPDSAAALRRFRYNTLAVVHLHADADLRGKGYQVAIGEDVRTLGVTWNAAMFDRDGVYTCYLGGGRDPAVLSWSDDRLGETAAREFEDATSAAADVLAVSRLDPGMPAYDRSWTALDDLSLPAGIDLCTNYAARAGIPGRVREAKGIARSIADDLAGRTSSGRDSRPTAANPRP